MREFGVGSNIAQFLGFKLQHFKSFINVTRKTPESLLHVTAMLITDGVISCADIYNHLIPSDKEMNENYKKYLINCRQAARKLTAAVLNEAVAEENAKEVQSLQVAPEFGDNQKLGLLQQLLVMGDWKSVNEMLELLPVPCSYVMSFGDVAYHLCQLVHEIIDPVYKRRVSFLIKFHKLWFRKVPQKGSKASKFFRRKSTKSILTSTICCWHSACFQGV